MRRNRWGPHPVTNGPTRVAQLIRARGVSRAEIMFATGMSDKTLNRACCRLDYTLPPHFRFKMANLLGVHPNELMS